MEPQIKKEEPVSKQDKLENEHWVTPDIQVLEVKEVTKAGGTFTPIQDDNYGYS